MRCYYDKFWNDYQFETSEKFMNTIYDAFVNKNSNTILLIYIKMDISDNVKGKDIPFKCGTKFTNHVYAYGTHDTSVSNDINVVTGESM